MAGDVKIGIFGAKTYPPEIGGIETHVSNIIKYFNDESYKFYLFVGRRKGEDNKADKSAERSNKKIYRNGKKI